ncbi:MAG: class I SAM-dependent methyltransferase [Pseudomonadota bacterium]
MPSLTPGDSDRDVTKALVETGRWLQAQDYRFVTVTPATHQINNTRGLVARDVRCIFGWNRPFLPEQLQVDIFELLNSHSLLRAENGGLFQSLVRFSTLDAGEALDTRLYAHSAYPTTEADSVFFGPDTYRFAALIRAEVTARPLGSSARILDVGCGAGPGGIEAAICLKPLQPRLVLSDINPKALQLAQVNADLAGLGGIHKCLGDLYKPVEGLFDLIVANPPYLVDAQHRAYRHGGGALGARLAERIVSEGLPRLAPGGRLVLYTGSAIVNGKDLFLDVVRPLLAEGHWNYRYRELDPDVFGEELQNPAYCDVERIAAVSLVVNSRA